jgi:ubiquinone/menaquinone biosynthesis C-methylase UbiE
MLNNLEIKKQFQYGIMDTMPIGDKIILNIGCGTGEAPLFTVMGARNYIGIDYSFTAADISFNNMKKLDGSGIIVQANAEALPIKDSSIDIVYSNGVLHHTPNTKKAFDEIYRVLKPKGKAVIGLYNTFSPHFISSKIIGFISSLIQKKNKGLKWYESSESAWRTKENTNPWTKTFSKFEIKKLLSNYNVSNLSIRKTSFNWRNAIPIIGKIIDNTNFGKKTSPKLHNIFGAMLVVVFLKKNH